MHASFPVGRGGKRRAVANLDDDFIDDGSIERGKYDSDDYEDSDDDDSDDTSKNCGPIKDV